MSDTTMDVRLLEQLLHEDESSTLDFKKEQYRFARATEDEKSELLKDILGFANGWRRSDAYILIGVDEVRGGRSTVVGITDHLDDHSLQQFVNHLTNRPVQFGYETCPLDGKQVGVIRIEEQARPTYLKKDYGTLEQGKVYVRRGSSTDPTKPATPEEIAQMGTAAARSSPEADLAVEFADPDREIVLGSRIPWSAEFCEMPEIEDIPLLSRPRSVHPLGIDLSALESITGDVLNEQYYQELANYEFFTRLFRRIRLVVTNKGMVAAENVRVELVIPKGERIGIPGWPDVPEPPKRKHSRMTIVQPSMKGIRPILQHAGDVEIDIDDDRVRLEIECRNLQPGRKLWSDDFYMGCAETGEFALQGHFYAENLSKPKEFTLRIDADVAQTSMTVDELLELSEPDHNGNESGDDED